MYKSNFKNVLVPDPKGWRHQKERDSSWNLPADWWKQSFLTQGKHLDLISGNLEISKLNQIPAIFVIFTSSSSSSSSHFWFPWEAHQECPTCCWCNSASPRGTWSELWDWVAETPVRGEGSEFWAWRFTPWEEGKALVKGVESLLQLVAFYGLLPHTFMAPPHWTASFKNSQARWFFSP